MGRLQTHGNTIYKIDYAIWLYIYCNRISDKFCISFTDVDVIYYCLHLNFNTLISCIATWQLITCVSNSCSTVKWQVMRGASPNADSILGGDIYFHFGLFSCFPSLQVGGAIANEIKHAHSPVVIVVFDFRHD